MNYVYLLRCGDDSLYCGWTNAPERRLAAHNSGRGSKYTRSRRPVALVYLEAHEDRREALSREWHIKRMSREEKMRLVESYEKAGADPSGGEGGGAPCQPLTHRTLECQCRPAKAAVEPSTTENHPGGGAHGS